MALALIDSTAACRRATAEAARVEGCACCSSFSFERNDEPRKEDIALRSKVKMPSQSPIESPQRFEVHMTADSHFSWLRTRLSFDRTLMSWIRTATAMIGFGFTIVQFFERLASMQGVAPALWPQCRARAHRGGGYRACDLDLAVPFGRSPPLERSLSNPSRSRRARDAATDARTRDFPHARWCACIRGDPPPRVLVEGPRIGARMVLGDRRRGGAETADVGWPRWRRCR